MGEGFLGGRLRGWFGGSEGSQEGRGVEARAQRLPSPPKKRGARARTRRGRRAAAATARQDDDVRRLLGHLGAGDAHRQADVRLLQRRRVVGACAVARVRVVGVCAGGEGGERERERFSASRQRGGMVAPAVLHGPPPPLPPPPQEEEQHNSKRAHRRKTAPPPSPSPLFPKTPKKERACASARRRP